MAMFYYNGELLPEIPIVESKPYVYVFKIISASDGLIYISCHLDAPCYVNDYMGMCNALFTSSACNGEMYSYQTEEWEKTDATTYEQDGVVNLIEPSGEILGDKLELLYANVNVPYGSAAATEIFLATSDPVPFKDKDYIIKESRMKEIANAIRTKTGTTDTMTVDEMPSAIDGISSGSGTELNIQYGDTEPTDTSALWLKCTKPTVVHVSSKSDIVGVLENPIGLWNDRIYFAASGLVGNNIYIFGGYTGSVILNTIYKYNTETLTYSEIATTFPLNIYKMAAGVVGTDIYLFGGGYSEGSKIYYVDTIYKFDTITETLELLSETLPIANSNIRVGVVGTDIYLFGGAKDTQLYKFDTKTETLSDAYTVDGSFGESIGIGVLGAKIYLFGGLTTSSPYYVDTIRVFDTKTNVLTTLDTKLAHASADIGVAVVGNKMFLFGGRKMNGGVSQIYMYDTNNNSLSYTGTTFSMIPYSICAEVIGNQIYLVAGNYTGLDESKKIKRYTVTEHLFKNTVQLLMGFDDKKLELSDGNVQIKSSIMKAYIGNAENKPEEVEMYTYQDGAWVLI